MKKNDKNLRNCLAEAIYAIDDGKLTEQKLHNLCDVIKNNIYNEFIDRPENESKFPTVLHNIDWYNDTLPHIDLYIEPGITILDSDILEVSTKKQAQKYIKKVEREAKNYKKEFKNTINECNSSIKTIDRVVKKLKADFEKDVNKDKKKNKTLL